MKKKKKKNKIIFFALFLLPLLALEDKSILASKKPEKTIDVDLALTSIQAKAHGYEFQKTGKMEKIIKNYPL